jgi:hypothetical protein
MLAISSKIMLKSFNYQQNNIKNMLMKILSWRCRLLNASPAPTAFMARLNPVRCAWAGEAMRPE